MKQKIGFWAAVSTGFWIIAFDLAVVSLALTVPSQPWTGIESHAAAYRSLPVWLTVVPSLLLAPSFLCLVACLDAETAPERRHLTRTALGMAAVYTALVGFNYAVQLTVVRAGLLSGETEGLALWTMGNPHSIFWALDVVGYGFMGLSGLFIAPALSSPTVAWLFRISAAVQVPATVAYVVTVNPYHPLVLVSLGAWGLLFPAATALVSSQQWTGSAAFGLRGWRK